ncbi:hypothetical protein [Yoonia sp. I 8.24]|uniref:hypothetical protein n=1 Tax=Yoonia sp. I 8.24 TaxID=1537229 RepID=UPI001EE13B66|nr:hypothetical protein [Yoonia sp. I 8.24]MCG3266740.1 hypothetical protein [Yoonia sp. I 8.24]
MLQLLKPAGIAVFATVGLGGCMEAPVEAAVEAAPEADAPAQATQPATSSGNAKATEAINQCLDNLPGHNATRTYLRTNGFRHEGKYTGVDFYTAYNRSIIVGLTRGSEAPYCFVGRNNLRDDEAVLVASNAMRAKYGDSFGEFDTSSDSEFIAAFYGERPDGVGVVAAVRNQFAVAGVYRGSIIVVHEYIAPDQ